MLYVNKLNKINKVANYFLNISNKGSSARHLNFQLGQSATVALRMS